MEQASHLPPRTQWPLDPAGELLSSRKRSAWQHLSSPGRARSPSLCAEAADALPSPMADLGLDSSSLCLSTVDHSPGWKDVVQSQECLSDVPIAVHMDYMLKLSYFVYSGLHLIKLN